MSTTSRYELPKVRLLHLLNELKSNSIEFGSLCVPPKSSITNIESIMKSILDMETAPKDLSKSIRDSSTGAILFWGSRSRYLVIPPFPITEERFSNTCEIEPLYSLMHKEFIIALVLVRLGAYGIGIFRGEHLLSSKVGTGLVHGRHRQGGSSAHRFERHREKQMETFFTRVCTHAREQIEPYARQLDYIIYGGTKETILDFRKQCHFLQEFNSRTQERLLNVREPKQSVLTEAIEKAWSCRVIQW